jgi:SPP1 gp7 family putative phage head morphogenesis protein
VAEAAAGEPFRFDLPPREAIAFFRAKGYQTGFSWQDVWAQENERAFTVAKMMDLDLLADTRAAVDRAIVEGQSIGEFRKALKPRLAAAGWWGRKEVTDPQTGETREVQLGSSRRLQTIFRVNVQQSYAAGDWAQIQATKQAAPYLMYDAIDDAATRPEHRRWDGTVLPIDDPWWSTHRPPNGWNCRCSVVQLSAADVERLGKSVAKEAPPVVLREHVNTRTGEVTRVPRGIDPGFAYNPGAASVELGRNAFGEAAKTLLDKAAAAPAALGAAAGQNLTAAEIAMLDRQHRDWVARSFERHERLARGDGQARDRMHKLAHVAHGDRRVVATVQPAVVAELERAGAPLARAGLVLDERQVGGHKWRRHRDSGDALTREEFEALPAQLRAPTAVLRDVRDGKLLYVLGRADARGRVIKAVIDPVSGEIETVFRTPTQSLGIPRNVLVAGALP